MADPELLGDGAQRRGDRASAIFGNPYVRKRHELQHPLIDAPKRPELIGRPASFDRGGDLVVIVALELPAMRAEIALQHVERRGRGVDGFGFGFDQGADPASCFVNPRYGALTWAQAQAIAAEIGSASCRERVCQYV